MAHSTQEAILAQAVVNSALAWAQAQGIQPQPNTLAILQQYTQGELNWFDVQEAFIKRNALLLSQVKSRVTQVPTL